MKKITFILGLAMFCVPTTTFAAGYELLEQSANAIGQATAGAATGYGDGSEVYFNPAAMTALSKDTASAGLHFIVPKAKFKNKSSSYAPQRGGAPLNGNDGGDGGGLALVPNVYGVWKLSDSVTGGLGVNSPFGLETEYDENWVGRYHAIKSELTTVNINPALAVKLDDDLSLGAGLQILYADAKLTNAVDLGAVGVAALGLPTAASLGLLPQAADGSVKIKGDDWGVGAGVGGTYRPTKGVTVGVNWRSRINLHLTGEADFTVPTNALPLTQSGLFTDTGNSADVTLPEMVTFGGAVEMSDAWTLYADATWTRWTRFDKLTIEFDSVQPDATLEGNWNNTWRYALGTKYDLTDDWMLRSGIAWDASPIDNGLTRTPRIPDQDRFWIALGLGYNVMRNTVLSIDYAHLFVREGTTTTLPTSTGAILNGDWDLGVDIASVGVTTYF